MNLTREIKKNEIKSFYVFIKKTHKTFKIFK